MARAGGGGGGAEPRRRRERSRSREESKAGESMSSSTGMANQHPVFLSWRSLEGSRHIRKKGRGQHEREWGICVRPSGRPEERIIVEETYKHQNYQTL